jgi:hypothetical protein
LCVSRFSSFVSKFINLIPAFIRMRGYETYIRACAG